MPYLLYLALLACTGLASLALPQHARADAQVSARGFLEFGNRKAYVGDEFIVALGMRTDAMFGPARVGAFRIGPVVEFRTADFWSAEAATGVGILIPVFKTFPLGLAGMVGAATRKEAPDGMLAAGTATWGFRGYGYKGWYAYGLNFVGQYRQHLGKEDLREWTVGVEVDMMFAAVIPGAAIYTLLTGGDPHEKK